MDLLNSFRQHFASEPAYLTRAPGRVNILGDHVDYNDGLVLPAAIDLAVHLAAAPSGDDTVQLLALDLNEEIAFHLDDLDVKTDLNGQLLPEWALYPAGVAWALRRADLRVKGLQAVFTSDIPNGAGLSSSAAIQVAFSVTWRALGGWQRDCLVLAQLCLEAERDYIGLDCGLMDQFASACGVEGHAICLDTRSLDYEPIRLPEGIAIVIADSGVRRSLTNSAYNERQASCQSALAILKEHMPGVQSLRDVPPTEYAAFSFFLPDEERRCGEHVVKEIARVESMLSALQRDDIQAMGALMYAGHASLRNLYEVSTPELDTLVELSRGLPGCIGARLTGAGFGGCTVNLVEEKHAGEFITGLARGYQAATGKQAKVYLCHASQGATVEKVT